MSEPLFWTRCPEAKEYDWNTGVKAWSCECHWRTVGLVAWPQPCPECGGEGTVPCDGKHKACTDSRQVPCPAGCDGGRVWPQGWWLVNEGDCWPQVSSSQVLVVPLEEP